MTPKNTSTHTPTAGSTLLVHALCIDELWRAIHQTKVNYSPFPKRHDAQTAPHTTRSRDSFSMQFLTAPIAARTTSLLSHSPAHKTYSPAHKTDMAKRRPATNLRMHAVQPVKKISAVHTLQTVTSHAPSFHPRRELPTPTVNITHATVRATCTYLKHAFTPDTTIPISTQQTHVKHAKPQNPVPIMDVIGPHNATARTTKLEQSGRMTPTTTRYPEICRCTKLNSHNRREGVRMSDTTHPYMCRSPKMYHTIRCQHTHSGTVQPGSCCSRDTPGARVLCRRLA